MDAGPDGLILHDTVREVVAELLRTNDPRRHRAHRVAAWRQLRRELRTARPADLWRQTADLLYLIENPAVREAFFPTTDHRYSVEPARPEDAEQIDAIVGRHETAAAAEVARVWWRVLPTAFHVARDADGAPAAVRCLCEASEVPVHLLAIDPVVAAWRTHLREQPVPRGQRVLFQRLLLDGEVGAATAPATAALVLDLKRVYLELRPALRSSGSP